MNPFLNAFLAAAYIVGIVFTMSTFVDTEPLEGTLFLPIAMLGLLVLSVATMGFLFAYKPLQLYFDNRKQEATTYFLKTLGIFALFVAVYLAFLIFWIR